MDTTMEINRETASRLWVKQFGKKQKAFDFAGREIARAAYNDRNSDYGWNVDHILPESRGGKTADHNLICCSIKTNDEKAARFPSFKANGKLFEIQRRENHYEIILKSQNDSSDTSNESDAINFFDAAQGVKCWRNCKIPNDSKVFVDYVKIKVEFSDSNSNAAEKFKEFIKEIFQTDNVFEESNDYLYNSSNRTKIFTIVSFNAPSKDDSEELLEKCIILNTYREFLIAKSDITNYFILCGMNCYDNRAMMTSSVFNDIIKNYNFSFSENLAINDLIRINTSAKKDLGENPQALYKPRLFIQNQAEWYPYNYTYNKLADNLAKRIQN